MKTIARNATRQLAAIKAKSLTCRAFGARNQYAGETCDPGYAWQRLYEFDFARLTVNDNGRYTIHVTAGEFYHLTETAL